MSSWYSIRSAAAKPKMAEIYIFDAIGEGGLTATDFIRDLKALGEVSEITIRINSPGGSVFDGNVIYNALKAHSATVTAVIDGLAASMASVIAMAADTVLMPENAMMMVHDPSGLVAGNARDMREFADVLDKVAATAVSAYVAKTGLGRDRIVSMMEAETWMTAAEAVEFGFADRVTAPVAIAARFDLSKYHHPPAGSATPKTIAGPDRAVAVMHRVLARTGLKPAGDGAAPRRVEAVASPPPREVSLQAHDENPSPLSPDPAAEIQALTERARRRFPGAIPEGAAAKLVATGATREQAVGALLDMIVDQPDPIASVGAAAPNMRRQLSEAGTSAGEVSAASSMRRILGGAS